MNYESLLPLGSENSDWANNMMNDIIVDKAKTVYVKGDAVIDGDITITGEINKKNIVAWEEVTQEDIVQGAKCIHCDGKLVALDDALARCLQCKVYYKGYSTLKCKECNG